MNEMSPIRRIVGPTILLHSGNYFDLLAPEQSEFTIEDVAVALSHICRFAGQCVRFYSVAQHSCHVADLVAPEHAFAGLMHDAAEAFIGDVAKPLKVLLPEYMRLEKTIEAAVMSRFGVPYPMPPEVKEIDIVMLATEQRQLMMNRDDWKFTRGRAPVSFHIPTWSIERARAEFLERYEALRPRAA